MRNFIDRREVRNVRARLPETARQLPQFSVLFELDSIRAACLHHVDVPYVNDTRAVKRISQLRFELVSITIRDAFEHESTRYENDTTKWVESSLEVWLLSFFCRVLFQRLVILRLSA